MPRSSAARRVVLRLVAAEPVVDACAASTPTRNRSGPPEPGVPDVGGAAAPGEVGAIAIERVGVVLRDGGAGKAEERDVE